MSEKMGQLDLVFVVDNTGSMVFDNLTNISPKLTILRLKCFY